MIQRKIRTLIEIDSEVWSLTKAYATLKRYNISEALKELLEESLQEKGFSFKPTPKTTAPSNFKIFKDQ